MSKKLKARELMWMMAPVALLGGVAWWFGQGGKPLGLRLGNPFDPGPLRAEYTPFQQVELSPYDVSQGYNWAAVTRAQVLGSWSAPVGWKKIAAGAEPHGLKLVYRRGHVWKQASLVKKNKLSALQIAVENDKTTLKVDLVNVPRDAQEVRLRGYFQGSQVWSGAVPRGWKPPKNWVRFSGRQSLLTFDSKPFDIQIKGPNEPFPRPIISHQSPLQVVDAKWIVDGGENNFVLQVRRTDGQAWATNGVTGQNVQVIDEKGHPVILGRNPTVIPGFFNQELFSPQRADTDLFVPFILINGSHDPSSEVPFQGPLHLRAQISDGQSWPLSVDVKVPRVEMKLSDFGAAK